MLAFQDDKAVQVGNMDRIPGEILLHLVEDVALGQAKATADLKAVRLCCSMFELIAARCLFRKIYLFMTEPSFERMAAIARHPKLRYEVQSIVIYPTLRSENLLWKEIYIREVRKMALTVPDLS